MGEIFRTDQIGSLLRPPELLEARAKYGEGKIQLEQLRETEDKAILGALEMQAKDWHRRCRGWRVQKTGLLFGTV